jgi:hypothetical protein
MHLTVDNCLELYSELAKDVFGEERLSLRGLWRAKFDADKLKNVVIKTLEDNGFNKDATMMDDSNIGCKT